MSGSGPAYNLLSPARSVAAYSRLRLHFSQFCRKKKRSGERNSSPIEVRRATSRDVDTAKRRSIRERSWKTRERELNTLSSGKHPAEGGVFGKSVSNSSLIGRRESSITSERNRSRSFAVGCGRGRTSHNSSNQSSGISIEERIPW